MTATLVVNTVYGPVHQGEGPSAGRVCAFIRLMGCNLTCDWSGAGGVLCDEAQTWNAELYDLHKQGHRLEVAEIVGRATARSHGMVVITGGEPLLHQDQQGWGELLTKLRSAHQRIEVETNGTQQPGMFGALVDQWNVSPKLASSGVEREKRIVPGVLKFFARDRRSAFKFVCTGVNDVRDVQDLVNEYRLPSGRVWIMPEGVAQADLLHRARLLAPVALEAGFNLTLRQHHLVYGAEGEPKQ